MDGLGVVLAGRQTWMLYIYIHPKMGGGGGGGGGGATAFPPGPTPL